MKMDEVANSGNDEFYTPLYAIKPIVPYLKPNSLVWCPFDTEDSLFVKHLRSVGHDVIATHISNQNGGATKVVWTGCTFCNAIRCSWTL